jgi:hypothetical protein
MAAAYSIDLRERVIRDAAAGPSSKECCPAHRPLAATMLCAPGDAVRADPANTSYRFDVDA